MGLDPSLELFMQAFNGVCRAQGSPLRGRIAQEGEQPFSGFFLAVRHAPAPEPPLGQERLAFLARFLGVLGVHHVVVVGLDLVVQVLGGMGQQVALPVCTLQRWTAISDHRLASAASRPLPPSTMRSSGAFRPRARRSSSTDRQAACVSPPMFLTARSTFWPSRRTPRATSSGIEVTRLSKRTLTLGAVQDQPHDILLRQIPGAARPPSRPAPCARPGSRVSFDTAPPNRLAKARRTRRVLVPAR